MSPSEARREDARESGARLCHPPSEPLVRPSPMKLACIFVLCAVASGCAKQPTMKLHHAEINRVQLGFPPTLDVQMTVVMDVYNPNRYDVAIRAMRGTVTIYDRATAIDFRPAGEGVWLGAKRTTQVRVPVSLPLPFALRIARDALGRPVPYHVVGRADVTASRSMTIERDDYGIDARGKITRQHIEASIALGL
jgi:hypothetical protein